MSTPRPAATLLALMIATLPRLALWNPSPDTMHDHAARTRGAIATPDRAAHSVLALSLLHTAANPISPVMHTSQTPRTRSGASRAAEQPRLRGALRAGEPTFMMWISLPKTNLLAISDGSTQTLHNTTPRGGNARDSVRYVHRRQLTLVRARENRGAQPQPTQENPTLIQKYHHLLTGNNLNNMQQASGRGGAQPAAPNQQDAQEDRRKRPAANTPEGEQQQPQATKNTSKNIKPTTQMTQRVSTRETPESKRLSRAKDKEYTARQSNNKKSEYESRNLTITNHQKPIPNTTQVTSLSEVPRMRVPSKYSRNLQSRFEGQQQQQVQQPGFDIQGALHQQPPYPQYNHPPANQGYNTYQPQGVHQPGGHYPHQQPQQQGHYQSHPPGQYQQNPPRQHDRQQIPNQQAQNQQRPPQQAPPPEFSSNTVATVRDEDDLEQTFIKIIPVSYTHLTLPTTPYV